MRVIPQSLPHFILSFCVLLSLVRGMNIGFFYPSDENLIGTIDYSIQTAMNGILLIGIITYFFLAKNFKFLGESLSSVAIVLIIFGICLSLGVSVDRVQSLKFLLALMVVTIPVILYARVHSIEALIRLLGLFSIVMVFLNITYVVVIPDYGVMTGNHDGKWKGLFEHKNTAGPFFALSSLFLIGLDTTRSKGMTLLKYTSLILCGVFVFFSQSSSALVALVIVLLFYPVSLFFLKLGKPKLSLGIILISLSLGIVLFTIFGDHILGLFFELTGKDVTFTGRVGVWSAIMDVVNQRPLLGYGPGMSERNEFMERIQGVVGWEVKGTHNGYLDLLLNFGYPTTLLMIFYILKKMTSFFIIGTDRKDFIKYIAIATTMIVTVLILGFANAATFYSRSYVWIFCVVGLVILSSIKSKPIAEPQISAK